MTAVKAKKSFGQHFLKSESVVRRILDLLEASAGEAVVEIGPGRGALTFGLAGAGVKLLAVEFERGAFDYLEKKLHGRSNVTLVNKDFLRLTAGEIGLDSFKLIGNLPFNITSPVLDWVVANRAYVRLAVFMVQKEMAQRVSSSPGSKDWSPPAIFTQLHYDIEYGFDVAAKHFSPPPKVTSAVIKLTPKAAPAVAHFSAFEKVVRASFQRRRKLLVNNLAPEIIGEAARAREVITELGLPPRCRAEELPTEKFLELTARLIEYKILQGE